MVLNREDLPEIRRRIANYKIGGMTFDSYDPNRDPTGTIGVALADLAYNAQKQITSERRFGRLERMAGS